MATVRRWLDAKRVEEPKRTNILAETSPSYLNVAQNPFKGKVEHGINMTTKENYLKRLEKDMADMNKRTFDQTMTPTSPSEEPIRYGLTSTNPLSEDDLDNSPTYTITDNCDQTRRKIHRFLDNDGHRILQHGPHEGQQSDIWLKAARFFKQREELGLPMPKKRKLSKDGEDKEKTPKNKKNASEPGKETTDFYLSTVRLPGEENDEVKIYDTCNEIGRKIELRIKKPGVTQAAFLRDLMAQFHTDRAPARLISFQLEKFRSKKGADAGCTSNIFYASYVFFEKLRIEEGKPKTKHRLAMEERWTELGGFDTEHAVKYISAPKGTQVWMDQYGRMHSE